MPCQIGAKEVVKLDDELGGDTFDVFVVFVDPRENESDLRNWKGALPTVTGLLPLTAQLMH